MFIIIFFFPKNALFFFFATINGKNIWGGETGIEKKQKDKKQGIKKN